MTQRIKDLGRAIHGAANEARGRYNDAPAKMKKRLQLAGLAGLIAANIAIMPASPVVAGLSLVGCAAAVLLWTVADVLEVLF